MEGNTALNLAEAREFLGVSEKTLRNYCKAGKLPFHQERNLRGVMEYRFRLADLEAYLQQRGNAGRNDGKVRGAQGNGGVANPEIANVISSDVPAFSVQSGSVSGAGQAAHRRQYTNSSEAEDVAASGNGTQAPGVALGAGAAVYADQLIAHLRQEVDFLKEQLQEKDRQMASKDRQLERQLERISNLNETLATLAQDVLKR